jgi:hypothetical protein
MPKQQRNHIGADALGNWVILHGIDFLLQNSARLYQKYHAPRGSDQNVRLLKRSKSSKVASKATSQKTAIHMETRSLAQGRRKHSPETMTLLQLIRILIIK